MINYNNENTNNMTKAHMNNTVAQDQNNIA